ncbi:superoxide dismutase [Mn], mitochondrial-like [Clytia hemisphaerica]|uniref:superoxide dismutase [Mn], mitochondrial-like n=1 Tax=Clytia hemisphaerica TaxID=252671 RepID=UPI0034D4696B
MLSTVARNTRRALSKQALQTVQVASKHTLPALDYEYSSLEPIIPEEIMTLHHSKHHQTYVNNLNAAEEQLQDALSQGDLLAAIVRDFGSFANMKEQLTNATVAVQGSGWGWLGYDKKTSMLTIDAMANQDPLQSTTGRIPLLGIDVWEHAYYLQYKNVRPDYVKAIFDIVNWSNVSERYENAM